MTWIIIIVFLILTIGAALFYYFRFCKKIEIVNADIVKSVKWLKKLPDGDNNDRFHDIDTELKKNNSVGVIWQDFSKSLTQYTDENGQQAVYSISDAAAFFSYSQFMQNFNMPFWNTYSGIFTGLGILGTFLGLTLGLYGIDMASSDINVLKEGISGLLSGVQFAFLTSLIGIFVAILHGFWHNKQIVALKTSVLSLSDEIEKLFPRLTAEQWLAKQYTESQDQTKTLKNLSEDMARDLGDLLDEQLNSGIAELCKQLEEKMTPIFDKLSDAIGELSSGGASTVGEIISDKAGKQIEQFAASLHDLQQVMQQNIESSQRAAAEMNQRMLDAVEKISGAMMRGANDTVDKQNDMMTAIQNQLENMAKTIAASSEEAIKDQREAVKDMQVQMVKLMKAVNVSSENSVKNISEANNALQLQVGQTLADVQKSMTQNITSSQEIADTMNKQILDTMNKIGNSLVNGANDAATKQREAVTSMQGQMAAIMDFVNGASQETAKNVQDLSSSIQKRSAESIEHTQNATMTIIKGLKEFADEQKLLIQEINIEFKAQLDNACQSLQAMINAHNDSLHKSFEGMNNFTAQTEDVLSRMKDTGIAIESTVNPLKNATADLTKQIELNRQETKQLHDNVSAQINKIATANETITANIDAMINGMDQQHKNIANAWAQYGKTYDNISQELANSTDIVTDRLQKYNGMMSEGMKDALTKFDKSVANATGALKGVVEELQETVDSLKQG